MHKTWSWHFTYLLPFLCYYIVFLYWVQRDIVKSTKNIDLLWLENWYSWMRATSYIHLSYWSPFFISLIVFLYWIHVVIAIETSYSIYAISENSSSEGSSSLVHWRYQFPFFSFRVKDFNRFQRLIIFSSKTANRIDFVILADYSCKLISCLIHRFLFLPLKSRDIISLYGIKYTISIVSTNEIKNIS